MEIGGVLWRDHRGLCSLRREEEIREDRMTVG